MVTGGNILGFLAMRPHTHSQRGVAFVEFVITFLMFFTTIVLTVDIIRLSICTVTAQFIVDKAIREVVLRPVYGSTESAEAVVCQQAAKFGWDGALHCSDGGNSDRIRICSGLAGGSCGWNSSEATGQGRDLVLVSIRYPFDFTFVGHVTVDIKADAIGRNEPF
jgi:hypothetical protein